MDDKLFKELEANLKEALVRIKELEDYKKVQQDMEARRSAMLDAQFVTIDTEKQPKLSLFSKLFKWRK